MESEIRDRCIYDVSKVCVCMYVCMCVCVQVVCGISVCNTCKTCSKQNISM